MLDLLIARVKARLTSDRGATMVEYGLMVALIAIVAALAVLAVGNELTALFTTVVACLQAPGGC